MEKEYLIPVTSKEEKIIKVKASSLQDAVLNLRAEMAQKNDGIVYIIDEEEARILNEVF